MIDTQLIKIGNKNLAMRTLISIFILTCFWGIQKSHAQIVPDSLVIKAISKSDGSNVYIRWVPLNYETFQQGNNHGYSIIRRTIAVNGTRLSLADQHNSTIYLDSLLLPLPEMDWEDMADTSDFAGVAAGAIHGEDFEVDSLSGSDVVKAYSQTTERQNRFGFGLFAADQSFDIAENMALGFIDSTAISGELYLYRIVPLGTDSLQYVRNGSTRAILDSVLTLPVPEAIVAFPGDRMVQISWSNEEIIGYYTGYIIERSADNGSVFSSVNDLPLVQTVQEGLESRQMHFLDSLPNNDDLFVYRVRGKSPFGDLGPPSDTVHVKGQPSPLNVYPKITNVLDDTLSGGNEH